MDYLTDVEKNIVKYNDTFCFPKRELTEIEKEILRMITIYKMENLETESSAKGIFDLQKSNELDNCLNRLKALTCNDRLPNKFKEAFKSPAAFDELTEKYPYAKYMDFINRKIALTPIEQLARDAFTNNDVRRLIQWIGTMGLTFDQDLPKGIDTFIWTPYTRYYNTHEMAKAAGDKALYGIVLSDEKQKRVNVLLGNREDHGYSAGNFSMFHIRRTGLHKTPDVWKRFNMEDIANEYLSKGVTIDFCEGYAGLQPYSYMELKQESTNTRLRFIVEG